MVKDQKPCQEDISYRQRCFASILSSSREITQHFLRADYPAKTVQEAFSRAYHKDGAILLNPPHRVLEEDRNNKVLITTYHPRGRILGDIVKRNWDILDKSSSTREILKWKTTQGFRRPTNIKDILVKARVLDPTTTSSPTSKC